MRIPHTRGDEPNKTRPHRVIMTVFPTHVGMNRKVLQWLMKRKVFPTHVGMNRALTVTTVVSSRIPHTRGDEPFRPECIHSSFKYSPHTWG